MSSKSDRDNRSTQLNPDNPASASSRAGSFRDDDDDGEPVSYVDRYFYTPPRATPFQVIGQYGVGVVSQEGEARFVTFCLEATASATLLYSHSSLQARMEDYFERFAIHVHGLFHVHFKAPPVLYVQFDGTSGRLPWHVPLNLEQPETMRTFLMSHKPQMNCAPAPDAVIELLCDRLSEPSEDWGTFQVLHRDASDLTFIYARRCNAEIQKNSHPGATAIEAIRTKPII
ncbi:hypothetical protein HDG40_001948 [Paraburkholderia sp. JPY158]|uniref:Uncharacterized protein n=1 Tax=Paraburkholderia atlantica TaxID=2654982 RepID=A0A7W8V5I1_PARAM|nr:hypothetical protein [Paraburkholderia atlantica]MBB5423804.1 hypothetical protein [Paraburkholderia atlantica]